MPLAAGARIRRTSLTSPCRHLDSVMPLTLCRKSSLASNAIRLARAQTSNWLPLLRPAATRTRHPDLVAALCIKAAGAASKKETPRRSSAAQKKPYSKTQA